MTMKGTLSLNSFQLWFILLFLPFKIYFIAKNDNLFCLYIINLEKKKDGKEKRGEIYKTRSMFVC